jgi:hypothetical protein
LLKLEIFERKIRLKDAADLLLLVGMTTTTMMINLKTISVDI